jgi:hypothetical protein
LNSYEEFDLVVEVAVFRYFSGWFFPTSDSNARQTEPARFIHALQAS